MTNPATAQPAAEKATEPQRVWIVSVVMVQNGLNSINTQNKLYQITASETAEARGKARELAASDFPQHYAHTVCQIEVTNQSAGVDALTEAAQANFAWHVAEELNIGSFQARMELCNYAQWLTRKALGDLSGYEGVPRLLLDTQTLSVDIARCDVEGCKALVKEALDRAAQAAELRGER